MNYKPSPLNVARVVGNKKKGKNMFKSLVAKIFYKCKLDVKSGGGA